MARLLAEAFGNGHDAVVHDKDVLDDDPLSAAIVVWTGHGTEIVPRPNDERVVAKFGLEEALDLLPKVHRLYDVFYDAERFVDDTLDELVDRAVDRFKRMYPQISNDAVRAFAWCYSFDYK